MLHVSLSRVACMSSSCLITMQPAACVFSSCPSLRLSASRGSMVRPFFFFFFKGNLYWFSTSFVSSQCGAESLRTLSKKWVGGLSVQANRKESFPFIYCWWWNVFRCDPCCLFSSSVCPNCWQSVLRRNKETHVFTVFTQVRIAFMITLRTWLATAQVLTSSTVGCSSHRPHALWVSTH